ncbi:HEAT repeat domain-containing protein [Chloroflexota bacterium]
MPGPEDYMNYDSSDVFVMAKNKDVEGLIGILKYSKNKNAVKQAIFALGEIKDKKAVEPLVELMLEIKPIAIILAAIRALGDMESNEAIEPLIYVMLKNRSTTLEAVRSLGKIKDGRAIKTLSMLMNDEAEDLDVRKETAEALGKIATEEAIHSLIAALNELGDTVLEVLKEVGEPAVMPLIAVLSGGNEPIIWEVSTILGEIRDKRAVKPLITLLLDESKYDSKKGGYVAVALGRIGDTGAVEPLIELASKHIEDMLTCMSVRALGDIGDHRAVDALIAILDDERTIECSHLRLETCWALGKIRDVRAIESLIRILGDTRNNLASIQNVQDAAALALVELNDDRIELPLLRYFKKQLGIDTRAIFQMPEYDEYGNDKHGTVLRALGKLIARLIDKS